MAQMNLATFSAPNSAEVWKSVNDGVMGGISTGGVTRTKEGTLLFTGNLSLENNGGFASIRTREVVKDLSAMSHIVVNLRGDGRTYWVELRTAGQMGASSYRANLPTTDGEWREVRVPLTDFKLQAFGRALPIKPLNPAAVASMGFTLADKKAGPFSLEIKSVTATADQATPTSAKSNTSKECGKNLVEVAMENGGFKTLLAAANAAELAGVLAGEGPYTLFAPTDDAFAKLPEGTVANLLKPENRDQLVAILKNHIISGKVTLAQALEVREATNLQGAKLSARFENGQVQIGTAALLTADVAASNGIIHVIDQVLIPANLVNSKSMVSSPENLIKLAIKRGVPLFNRGDISACASLYEITAEALLLTDQVSEETRKEVQKSLVSARAESSPRNQAWILRGALDEAWSRLEKN